MRKKLMMKTKKKSPKNARTARRTAERIAHSTTANNVARDQQIKELHAAGENYTAIGQRFGITRKRVWQICKGHVDRLKKAPGYTPEVPREYVKQTLETAASRVKQTLEAEATMLRQALEKAGQLTYPMNLAQRRRALIERSHTVQQLHAQGMKTRHIAEKLGITQALVYNDLKRR